MAVAPYAAAGEQPTPLRIKTAIFMTLRNEDAARAILRFKTVKASVEQTGEGAAFSYFVLERQQRPRRRRGRGGGRRRLEEPPTATAIASSTAGAATTPATRPATCATSAPAGATQFEPDAAAGCRQPDVGRRDRALGAHDAGASEDRHPAKPRGRHAVVERFCAHFPVRHAPRHARLHHGSGLVGGRLRALLGAQCAGAHQAVP